MSSLDVDEKNALMERFKEFVRGFKAEDGRETYIDAMRGMADNGSDRLTLNLNDLRTFDPELARGLLDHPSKYLAAFEEALPGQIADISPISFDKNKTTGSEYFVGVTGSFGAHQVSPRGLLCELLNRLVCVEGIISRCTTVHPKVVSTMHYCKATKSFESRDYRDMTSTTGIPTTTAYPTKNKDGHLLTTEFGLCKYRDHQMVTIQEMPERAPPGQLPRSIEVLLENELVDQCRPGNRVRVSGIFRALPAKVSTTGMFRTLVLGNHVRLLSREASAPELDVDDIKNIKRLSKSKEIIPEFIRSLAPSVYGSDDVKQALLLMMLGGVEKNLANGTHLRGDINVLMVGDPSTAKSQILRFAMSIAPLAISTTGRGSSGVGLTAAVTTDSETGERRLEAGAMVLADRGICCIDEFDKMLEADRVAIHEVMEQQTITIAKAGIHASLNARTSVLAAANPVYGKYNREHSPMENIGLPDSLLSRFDLLFIVLDSRSSDTDRAISGHVLQMHRTSKTGATPAALAAFGGGRGGDVVEDHEEDSLDADATGKTPMYVKFERGTLQTGPGGRRGRGTVSRQVLSTAFLKKYIAYARKHIAPVMSQEACERIAAEYASLRQRAAGTETRCLPITPRTLETMIRLSTAFAKLQLRPRVLEEHVASAIELMHGALFKDIPREKKRKITAAKADDQDGGDDDDDDDAQNAARPSTDAGLDASPARGTRRGAPADDDDDDVARKTPASGRRAREVAALAAAADVDFAASPLGGTQQLDVETQDEEAAVPIDQLPAGAVERLRAALVELTTREGNVSTFAIAEVFSVFADKHVADGLAEPTMAVLLGALAAPEVSTDVYFSDGSVYMLA